MVRITIADNKSKQSIIMIKDKNKEVYTSPITEALELRFEGLICLSNYGEDNAPGQSFSGGNTIFDPVDF